MEYYESDNKAQDVEIFDALTGKTEKTKKIVKSAEDWVLQLDDEQYRITRKKGTERAFTGQYWDSKKNGIYSCVCCGTHLFSSNKKFDSGTGWPSFWDVVSENNIDTREDNSYFVKRTEVICKKCDAHLGHVFKDGPPPTNKRYCINSLALNFTEKENEK